MSNSVKRTYDNLEVQINKDAGGNGKITAENLRRLQYQQKEKLELIPTDDKEVKDALRFLNEPETFGSEDEFKRRERLSELLFLNQNYLSAFKAHIKKGKVEANLLGTQNETEEKEEEEEEDFYTPACLELINARKFLIKYTYEKSKERLLRRSREISSVEIPQVINRRRDINRKISHMELMGSQLASTRPISQVKLSSDDKYIAVADWDGGLKICDVGSLSVVCALDNIHQGKVGGIEWSSDDSMIVSGAEDAYVKLFKVEDNKIQEVLMLEGHERRVTDAAFHPSNKYVASASFDMTWRLWDINAGKEILLQEGHGKEVYSISFQQDGSLVCSAGVDHCGIVWDIRSGKCPMVLRGHVKPIYCVDWSSDGYTIATGAGDGTIKVWDLRKATDAFTILAHNSIISSVKFDREYSHTLISSGYDKNINAFSTDNWLKIKSLKGHTDKVLCADISSNSEFIVSSSWDRSIKLWGLDK